MIRPEQHWKRGGGRLLLLLLLISHSPLGIPSNAAAASIPEPATVFYGKIIGIDANYPFLVTEGELTWVVRRSDGMNLVLRAQIRALNNGEYSYQLQVPHHALAPGLDQSTGVPLRPVEETHTHFQIGVNGRAAQILGPGGSTFNVAQARRAASCRLDLVVPLSPLDLDGNGLADWWESRYGLEDANGDPDGDGLSNLAELRKGSDPKRDDRIPSLVSKQVRAYAKGTTALMLRAVDADSAPADVTFTLGALPGEGVLYLRNWNPDPGNCDRQLEAGSVFSQADVNSGRVLFVSQPADSAASSTTFEVILRDEDPSHAASTNVVWVNIYRPVPDVAPNSGSSRLAILSAITCSLEERPFLGSYLLSRDLGHIVCDGASEAYGMDLSVPSSALTPSQYQSNYVPNYGLERSHVLLGGLGSDRLSGGMEGDVLAGAHGNDFLRGNGGGDLFLLHSRNDGSDTIEDFNPSENDVLDLTSVLNGPSPLLDDYLQVATAGTNTVLSINCGGMINRQPSITDLTVTLAGLQLTRDDVIGLVERGALLTGDKRPLPRISIAATVPTASENGPVPGEFTLTRIGTSATDSVVNLAVTGSAANGSDYRHVASSVTFPAGQRSMTVQITPYIDTLTELAEVVEIRLQPGNGYEVGASGLASVTIEDLAPEISIEALEPLAIKGSQTPGVLLLTRSAVLDRSVLVRLTVGGTALRSSDYDGVPNYVNLQPYQTTALIEVTPRPTAVLSNGAESVQVSLRTDPTYRLGNPSSARVVIVNEQLTFGDWRDRYFAGSTEDLFLFAQQDIGQTGIRHLYRYAFGLDAHAPQNSPGRPVFQVRDGHLTVAFRRPASISDVQYAVDVSEDLVSWHSGENDWEQFVAPEYAGDVEMVCYRARNSGATTPKLFMRVRVLYAP
jgi:hypothetical protein